MGSPIEVPRQVLPSQVPHSTIGGVSLSDLKELSEPTCLSRRGSSTVQREMCERMRRRKSPCSQQGTKELRFHQDKMTFGYLLQHPTTSAVTKIGRPPPTPSVSHVHFRTPNLEMLTLYPFPSAICLSWKKIEMKMLHALLNESCSKIARQSCSC